MKQVFIALGTNIEPREAHLFDALQALEVHDNIEIERKSSIYETVPVGYADQADFLNMVIKIGTTLSPVELLDICQSIEQQQGRVRTIRNGPRTIDLDILVYNQENRQTERITIPHPRMHKRAFVLIPLEEIASNLVIPSLERRVADLKNDLPKEDLEDVKKWTK